MSTKLRTPKPHGGPKPGQPHHAIRCHMSPHPHWGVPGTVPRVRSATKQQLIHACPPSSPETPLPAARTSVACFLPQPHRHTAMPGPMPLGSAHSLLASQHHTSVQFMPEGLPPSVSPCPLHLQPTCTCTAATCRPWPAPHSQPSARPTHASIPAITPPAALRIPCTRAGPTSHEPTL